MQLVVSLIYTNIIKEAVVPKTLAKVMKFLIGHNDRNKGSYMIVGAMGIFTILADGQELRQLSTTEVASEILTQRFKKRRDMLMVETGQITEVLVLGSVDIIIYREVRDIKMVMWQIFIVIREGEKVFTPAVLLIHGQIVSKTAHVVLIPAKVATFIANSTRNVEELTTLTGREIRVRYLSRTETHNP